MSWRDVLSTAPCTQNTHNPQKPNGGGNSAYSADSAYRGSERGEADPAAPCPTCRGGYYWREAPEAFWYCHTCQPPERLPWATRTVPGGRLPLRQAQDVVAVLRKAVAGLPLDADELRVNLAPEDLGGIAQGHITPATVRAFALHLIEQGPRTTGRTVYGVVVGSYAAD